MRDAVTALSALAQESRLRVFRLLVKTGIEGLPAGEIAEELDIPPATLSFHLKELSNACLVESERDGRSIIYRLQVDGIRELVSFVTEDCCQGRPELCMPSSEDSCCDKKKRKSNTRTNKTRKKKRVSA
ncbi:ArsR/SmtB family transcription factor [Planctomycetota bacterium]